MPEDVNVTPEETDGIKTEAPAANWLLSLPEDLQNDNLLNEVDSVETLARRFAETKRWADGRVKLPDENASPEEVQKFYSRLGVPEKPDGYEFTKVEIPEAVGVDLTALEAFKPVFHNLKLTKAQADGIQKAYLESVAEQHNKLVQEYTQDVQKKLEVLKGRWGDQFDTKVRTAQNYFNQTAPPGVKAYVERNGLGNDPEFIEWMYQKGVETSEDQFRPSAPGAAGSLDDAIRELELKIFSMTGNEPEYKELIARKNELYNQRYPERPE